MIGFFMPSDLGLDLILIFRRSKSRTSPQFNPLLLGPPSTLPENVNIIHI